MDLFDIVDALNDGGIAARAARAARAAEAAMADLDETADLDEMEGLIETDESLEAPDPAVPLGWRQRPVGAGAGFSIARRMPNTVELSLLGQYVRRSRYYASKSQAQLSGDTGVTQSMLSRLERGVAPGMRLDKLVALASTLGATFPLGFCPHKHRCDWSVIRPATFRQP